MTDEIPNTPILDPQSGAQASVITDRNHLKIPNKLYGRDQDITTLLESFERISSGHGEVLLVPGASGVGKTALVQALQGPIQKRNGFVIKGKFDQYQQNIPYFVFRQALAGLCREVQSADAHQRSRFKIEILQAVGALGQVLVELVPEFGEFLGVQPPLDAISPQEARHRLADVCRRFLKVICCPEHPLVLFLDDWQWADVASCELLKQLQVGTTLRYLLVIVSYRDNEVDPGHVFMSAVDDLRSQAVPVTELPVKNITAKDVREFVADTLKPATEDVARLATFIHTKTQGNPFFVRSFLEFLYEVQLIGFDTVRNCWQWSMDKIGGANLPDDVVGLFVLKLRRMDHDSQNLFSLAACLGNRFDLETLSIISGYTSEECLALLCSDQTTEMILPVDDEGVNGASESIRAPRVYTFVHDRIQQAAYSLIKPDELPKRLLKIGRLLLASLPPKQLAEQLFEVVGDLNAGFHLMTEAAEQEKALELNLTAARKAYAATAYRAALQFYRAANRFLEAPGFAGHLWRDRHKLTLRLFKERAGCEFLEGNLTEAEQCVQQAVAQASTAIEKADALSILIVQYTLLARYPEAIAAGRQALAALGISLPEADYEKVRNEEIAQVRRELGGRPVSSLIELPVMSNPEMLMASKILITMGPPCYRSHQRLWSVIVPRVVNLTLQYGNIPQIGYSHTAFGGLLGWVDDDYATAKEFGELATRLMTGTFRTPADQSVFYLMIGSSIRHWFQHLRHGTQDYHDAYEIGLRSGNLQYAAYAFGHDMYCRFYQGSPLASLLQETQRSLAFSRTRRNQWAIDLLEGGLNIFGSLSGESDALNAKDAWSETDFLRRLADHQNIQVACIYNVLKTFSLLLAGHHEDALVLSDETEPLIYTVGTQGLLPWPEHVFARLLILTALYSKADGKRQTQWRAELDRMLRRLRIWADNGPDNFEHKYLLAAAELARIDGRLAEAIPLYDQAAASARAGNFLQWEGLVNERAHDFWLERGNERLAHIYWQNAYVCFSHWGATAKVDSMETACRALLVKNLPAGAGSGKLEPEIGNAMVERQIKQLRDQASQAQDAQLRGETVTQTEELALALQRVRVEIAERKRTEDALREKEAELRTVLDATPFPVALVDIEDDNIKFWSQSARNLFGHVASTAFEWYQLAYPDPDYRREVIARWKPLLQEARRSHEPVNAGEYWVTCRDGSTRLCELYATFQADLLIVTFNDITARKQAETALYESRKLIEGILSAIPLRVFWKDCNLVYLGCNQAFARDAGFDDPSDIIGKDDFQMGWRAQADLYRGDDRAVIESGSQKLLIEEHQTTPEGKIITLLTSKMPLRNPQGEISGVLGVYEDITERKRIETELQRMDKLQSIGTLAGGIAHDFNNILQGLYGNLSLAKEDIEKTHPSYPLLEEAEKSMPRAVRLTKQLLTFAKGGNPVKESVSLEAKIEESVRFDLTGSNVKPNIHHDENLWPVDADMGQLQQVFSNLVINARQAMPSGGHLAISLENVVLPANTVPTLQQGRYVKVVVKDEGVGIDPTNLNRVFDPYFTTKSAGHGLGLATVWSIITKHGGHIGVESELGKGTTFTFYLPATTSRSSATDKMPVAENSAPARPAKLLVMDDEDSVNRLFVRMLTPCGYIVSTASNGPETIALYKQALEAGAPFDAVIMDLTIPGGPGGKEVIKDLLALDPNVRAIVSSGYAVDPVMANPGAYGFKGIVAKPYTSAALREAVARVLV
jgi:PAS domain S-box-containing protein